MGVINQEENLHEGFSLASNYNERTNTTLSFKKRREVKLEI